MILFFTHLTMLIIGMIFSDLILNTLFFIGEKIVWLFNPLIHPRILIFLIKRKLNPWTVTIKDIATIDESSFNKYLTLVKKDRISAWEKIRKDFL